MIIDILKNSLYTPYSISPKKFDINYLIKYDRRVDSILLQKFEEKIQHKVNVQRRKLDRIFIDFGPYPMCKTWQLKGKELVKNEED